MRENIENLPYVLAKYCFTDVFSGIQNINIYKIVSKIYLLGIDYI